MELTFSEPGITITVPNSKLSTFRDEVLAKALVEIWRARYNWTPQQIDRIIDMSKESYVDDGKR